MLIIRNICGVYKPQSPQQTAERRQPRPVGIDTSTHAADEFDMTPDRQRQSFPGMMRFMNSSNSGTVKAVSP